MTLALLLLLRFVSFILIARAAQQTHYTLLDSALASLCCVSFDL